MNAMALQFSRVVSPVEDMEIWNASSNGFSFAINYESRLQANDRDIGRGNVQWRFLRPMIRCARIRMSAKSHELLSLSEDFYFGFGTVIEEQVCRRELIVRRFHTI
jgi:hypothetical protein